MPFLAGWKKSPKRGNRNNREEIHSKLQTVYVSAGVLAIGEYAFALCSSLQTVHIPESVTAIGDNVFPTSGTSTIYGKTGSYAETYAKENNIPFVAE